MLIRMLLGDLLGRGLIVGGFRVFGVVVAGNVGCFFELFLVIISISCSILLSHCSADTSDHNFAMSI